MDIHRSYFYYTDKKDDTEVEDSIRAAAEFGDGFWKIYSTENPAFYNQLFDKSHVIC